MPKQPGFTAVEISKPDKVLLPGDGITNGDLAAEGSQ